MAFVSTNSQIKNNILNYISRLVSKTLYRAIEILFKPCCDITITDVQAVCTVDGDPGNYDITITLDKSVSMLGKGLALIIVGNNVVYNTDGLSFPYNDSTKIVLTNVNIGSASSGGNFAVSILFLMPVGVYDGNVKGVKGLTPGAFTIADSSVDFNFPSCEL